jgi:hypothetical protein
MDPGFRTIWKVKTSVEPEDLQRLRTAAARGATGPKMEGGDRWRLAVPVQGLPDVTSVYVLRHELFVDSFPFPDFGGRDGLV